MFQKYRSRISGKQVRKERLPQSNTSFWEEGPENSRGMKIKRMIFDKFIISNSIIKRNHFKVVKPLVNFFEFSEFFLQVLERSGFSIVIWVILIEFCQRVAISLMKWLYCQFFIKVLFCFFYYFYWPHFAYRFFQEKVLVDLLDFLCLLSVILREDLNLQKEFKIIHS